MKCELHSGYMVEAHKGTPVPRVLNNWPLLIETIESPTVLLII